MDENKICFIMCTNDALYEKECIYYIQKLYVPPHYEIEILPIKNASSIAQGYNKAMMQSDAKYKIYMHQDVFIVFDGFLERLLELFKDSHIGMVGMVGSTDIEDSYVMWYSNRVGMLHANSVYTADSYLFGKIENSYKEVSAVDGLLMATQYDILWREDILKNWDYYDISQSIEFRKRGYKVVVPAAEKPWCIHDDGILNLRNYYRERDIFLKEYMGK